MELIIDRLSDDAKAVAGAMFGMMRPNIGELVFHTASRISPRAKAALDELHRTGLVTCEELYGGLGRRYVPLVEFSACLAWLRRNPDRCRFSMTTGSTPGTISFTGNPVALVATIAAIKEGA